MKQITLTVNEFHTLGHDAQQEYLHFTEVYNRHKYELYALEQGLKAVAGYHIDPNLRLMARLNEQDKWVKEEIKKYTWVEEHKEDLERYFKRLEKICEAVRKEGK